MATVFSRTRQNIVKVVAGWGHSAALTKSGQLYVCGRNFQGQLGLGSPQRFPQNERGHPFQAEFCLIERLAHLKITQIACGGEHSVAVADNGEVRDRHGRRGERLVAVTGTEVAGWCSCPVSQDAAQHRWTENSVLYYWGYSAVVSMIITGIFRRLHPKSESNDQRSRLLSWEHL